MKFKIILLILTLQYSTFAQSTLNQIIDNSTLANEVVDEFLFVPSIEEIRNTLANAPRSSEIGENWVKMKIPLADGIYHNVEVAEAPVVGNAIYNRYPENRSYKLRGVDDNRISGRMSITALGMSALLYTESGNVFIEPAQGKYHRAYKHDRSIFDSFSCGTDHSNYKKSENSTTRTSIGSNERKYIMAVASTGEFSAKHSNNLSLINAAITDYLTLLNTLYERDLAITFELTDDNDDIIFFDPNSDGLNPANNSTKLSTAQTVISNAIGSANYDIGHVFYEMDPPSGGWWGSGVASLGVVCSSSSKARGWTGCGGSYPNSFWMGIFAHEVGHQFAATHTFYGTAGNCGGSQRSVGNGVEPGSGNSLMSYEGSCGAGGGCSSQNITPESSFQYFHSHSIDQIQTFVTGSGNCYTSTSSGNSPPVITMPGSKTIPKETPFYLSATVTDPDGDPLLCSWEQVDTDNLSLSCPNGAPNDAATSTTAPLFRSFDPSEDGDMRYFPQMSDILDNTQTMGEILPEVGRTIDMRFSARGTDPNGISGISYEDVTITVNGSSGPFEVTTATTPTGYLGGASVDVEWLVNNTDIAPVSCSNVNILFSSDGGDTYPITLASNTPNDGIQNVTMPLNATEEGRIKIEAVGNIFFSITKSEISIISDCEPNSSAIINDEAVTANVGDPALDLGLIVGEELTSVAGTLDGSDPSSNLIAENESSGSCVAFGNMPRYETYLLTASATDVYNFSSSSSLFEVVNIYEDVFVPPATSCQNWLASSFGYPSQTFTNPFSVSLVEGDVIEMVVSGFNTGDTGTYTVNFSSNGSGVLINSAILPSGYVYKYIIYNSSGYIIGIEDEADLTDGTKYFNDVYTVKGLMVLGATDLSSYINGTFVSLQNDVTSGAICGELSTNDVTVTVNGCNSGTKTVTSPLDDGGAGTLRYLTENACPGDVIQFDPSLSNATIVLGGQIIVDENVSITGLGINNLSLSGNDASRIFSINSGVTMSITGLALVDGYAASNGGAFVNNGTVQLENVKFVGNKNGAVSKAFTNLGNISMSNTVNIMD